MEIQKIGREEFQIINSRLADKYGYFESIKPYFRLMWSEDILEKRWMTHTDEGMQLLHPEVREVPKYRHYIKDRYILEGLTVVPKFVETDLIEEISYEPLWTFETGNGEFLIPTWPAIHHILETVRNAQQNKGGVKYKEDTSIEAQEQRIKQLEEELFGNETPITDALAYGRGVVVPKGPIKEN